MKFLIIRILSLAAFSLGAISLSSCSSVGLGPSGAGEYASTTIKSSDQALIRRTTVEVFAEKGFSVDGPSEFGTIHFSKKGSESARIAWGNNLNNNPVMVRPEVQVNPLGPKTQLICNVYMTQQSDVFGEDSKKPHFLGKAGYSSMLSTVRQRVEKAEP